jgi:PBP1b-binding outer membrane lipoprotein LpoB
VAFSLCSAPLVLFLMRSTSSTLPGSALAARSIKFTLVSTDQLNQAKQTLGLSPDDSLNSRSKAIGLARQMISPVCTSISCICSVGVFTSPCALL